MEEVIYLNGEYSPISQAKISLNNREILNILQIVKCIKITWRN